MFSNKEKRKSLNGITHPLVFKVMMNRIFISNVKRRLHLPFLGSKDNTMITAVDIPLFYETGLIMKMIFPLVIVIACNPSIQLERLQKRNPELSQEECKNRINSQMPLDVKVKQANIVIWNNDDVDSLCRTVKNVKKVIRNKVLGYDSIDLIHFYFLFSTLQFCWFVLK